QTEAGGTTYELRLIPRDRTNSSVRAATSGQFGTVPFSFVGRDGERSHGPRRGGAVHPLPVPDATRTTALPHSYSGMDNPSRRSQCLKQGTPIGREPQQHHGFSLDETYSTFQQRGSLRPQPERVQPNT